MRILRVFSIYQRHFLSDLGSGPEPSIAFESSTDFIPLQGADLVAWELYQRGKDWLATGPETEIRDNFQLLLNSGRIEAQIAVREVIERIFTNAANNELLRPMADFIEQPTVVFPPTLRARSVDGLWFQLEPIVSAGPLSPLDLPQKQWFPGDPSSGLELWSLPPLLRSLTPEPAQSRREESVGDAGSVMIACPFWIDRVGVLLGRSFE